MMKSIPPGLARLLRLAAVWGGIVFNWAGLMVLAALVLIESALM
jgi:hypothetical protein|tara:strand:- start:1934 stop:2065 length:132 start_codon:yes stop_codon:yes gene_type:complete